MDKKLGWVDYHKLPSEMFSLTVPKKIVQESISVSFDFGYRKILCIRGFASDFLLNFFCLTRPKKIVEESFRVSFSFGYRKSLCITWVYHDILSKFFCRTVPKKM